MLFIKQIYMIDQSRRCPLTHSQSNLNSPCMAPAWFYLSCISNTNLSFLLSSLTWRMHPKAHNTLRPIAMIRGVILSLASFSISTLTSVEVLF